MSNLTLPKMTFVTLKGMIGNARARHPFPTNPVIKLAYETTAEWDTSSDFDQTIVVRHHGNPIAEIGADFFTLDNAGWHSRTTARRLNRILRDNQTVLPSDPAVTDRLWYYVRINQGRMQLWGRPIQGKPRLLRDYDCSVTHFSRVSPDHHYVLQGGDEYQR